MINRTLDDRYTLLECVGSGGMADVYRAHDQLLDRSVAVKVLKPHLSSDKEFIAKFRREAQAAAKISHPNIVNIFDVGRDDGADYIVMEFISGETLKERIQRMGALPVDMAAHIAVEIAEALEQAHQNNIVHCDIKPHNILITRSGRVKVADFGIARAVTSSTMTQTATILGSVHYFSPEQARGGAISTQSDIYSLGIVLFEMVTGQVPFTGETPVSVALKHLQEEMPSPRAINPEVSPLLESIIMRATAKETENRYPVITQMIADLNVAMSQSRDEQTRRLAKQDFPTQVLPKVSDQAGSLPKQSDKPSAGSKNKKWLGIALLGLLLTGFALGAFLAFGKFWVVNEVAVPNVVGRQVDTAKNVIINSNLRVNVTDAFNNKVPLGYVISQSPEAGAMVKEQRTVTIVVSKGTEVATVPDVRGLTRREAELQIKNAGLVVGRVEEVSNSDAKPDSVINQNPRAPIQINKGSSVDLIISKGNGSGKKITLPDFRGTPLKTVLTQLESLKLKVGRITEIESDKFPTGTISGQNPSPASQVEENSTVDFTVAKNTAANPAAQQVKIQVEVPDGPIRQSVQIVVTDSKSREVVYEGVHRPGETIEKMLEVAGPVRVQVYINGVLRQEKTL